MNGVQLVNVILWFLIVICIWHLPPLNILITLLVVGIYGRTERWLGEDKEK